MSDYDWAYGAWLGDGCVTDKPDVRSGHNWLYESAEESVIERFKSGIGWTGTIRKYKNNNGNTMYRIDCYDCDLPYGCNAYNKRLPDYIWEASEESKWDMLQGLIDTDGNFAKDANVLRFNTVSPYLAEGFSKLLASLGWGSVIYKRKYNKGCGYIYQITIPSYIGCQIPLNKRGLKSHKPQKRGFRDLYEENGIPKVRYVNDAIDVKDCI